MVTIFNFTYLQCLIFHASQDSTTAWIMEIALDGGHPVMAYMTTRCRLQTTQPTRGGAVTAVWQTLCKLCRPLPPPAMGALLPFFASWPCGPAGWLAMLLIKAGNVETNPGPTTTRKQVWICDICHRQIQVRR